MTTTPTSMKPEEAGHILERSIADPRAPMTAADAAAKGGMSLRDAAQGMHWLTDRYRGHLRVTGDGELIFLFPHGFTRPWVQRDRLAAWASALGRAIGGLVRFVIRAWLLVVMVGYVVAFLGVLLALTFARSEGSSDRRGDGGGVVAMVLLRTLADALFWTFHPWSPVAMMPRGSSSWRREEREEREEVPFYEKVNRFVFGPPRPPEDPRAMERRLIAQIRAGKGRIGLADVMRVTGLPREKADPLMARLMLDYEGDVSVSDEGGISYRFEALRRSATAERVRPPPAAWDAAPAPAPLTGNTGGSNALIAGINAFNALMSLAALSAGLTVSKVIALVQGTPLAKLPAGGTAVALGVVPLAFSLVILLMPAVRAVLRPMRAARAARERGRLEVVRAVVQGASREPSLQEASLASAWRRGAGAPPTSEELRRVVLDLGGDVEDRDDGEVRYRFMDLTTEASAVAQAREEASEQEARAGSVVFTTER